MLPFNALHLTATEQIPICSGLDPPELAGCAREMFPQISASWGGAAAAGGRTGQGSETQGTLGRSPRMEVVFSRLQPPEPGGLGFSQSPQPQFTPSDQTVLHRPLYLSSCCGNCGSDIV